MMKWSAVAACAGCLVGTLAVALPAVAQNPSTTLAPALRAELAAGRERFHVIVNLRGSAATRRPLGREAADADRVAAVVGLLAAERAALERDLEQSELASMRPFVLQPGYAATLTRRGLLEVAKRPGVASVEPDLRLTTHTAEGLPMVGAPALHDLGLTGEGIAVAIIDTGIDAHHPSLGGAAIPNAKVVRGLDTADLDDDPADCGAHGTAVASIAAGTSYRWNPESRFAGGVAPQAKILAYKASPDADCGSFALSAVVAAMEDAILHRTGDGWRLAAINLSLGGGAFEGPCDDFAASYRNVMEAAGEAGIAVVASTGNQGMTGAIAAPACASDVLAVSSVWDSDSGWIGYSFCLDPQCDQRCDDSFQPAGRVTCYSNSGPMLDLLAPSEYLQAARAGGQTLAFGGTSGAAAYVTGALAVLAQAAPELDAGGLRRVLELAGEPTLDPRNGLLRRRLHLGRALDAMARLHPGGPATITAGGTTSSAMHVQQDGEVGSIRALLQLVHPDPTLLEVSLISPSGTRVRLHDRGPGTVPASGELPHQAAIWGLYPDEVDPVDSLGVLAGEPAGGVWTLEMRDLADPVGAPAQARLSGWALWIEPPRPPTAGAGLTETLPVAAHAPGAMGTDWRSEVRIFNPSPDRSAPARLYFVPSGENGTEVFRQTDLVLPSSTVIDLPDVVGRRFPSAGARGSLILQSDASGVVLTSRTFTGSEASGTYGQYVGAIDVAHTAAVGEPELAIGELGDGVSRRTNLGLTEISGAEAIVTVRRFDGMTGQPVGAPTQHRVEPFGHLQLAVAPDVGSDGYALLRVTGGSGRVAGYASLVDNGSGDAVFVPARRPTALDEMVVPVVASQPGLAQTLWKSSLRIVNLGDGPANLELELRPRRGSGRQPMTVGVSVAAGHQLAVDDVVGELFGLDRVVGLLRIVSLGGPSTLVVTSRTFNDSPGGTFGQLVTAVDADVGPHAVITHVDASSALRTNLGVAEVAGLQVQLVCTVLDAFGRRLGQPVTIALEPYQLDQVDDIVGAAGAGAVENGRIEISAVGGDGRFFAYASVVDRITGDAIFVPAEPLDR